MLNILYVGQLGSGATAEMRYRHLTKLGHSVTPINTDPPLPGNIASKAANTIFWRLGWPLGYKRLTRRISEAARVCPPDILWVDKGVRVTEEALLLVRRLSPGVKIVHYNPDDPFGRFGKAGWRHFIKAMPAYDIHFVPRRENIYEYQSLGCKRVIHNIPTRGFDPDIHRPYTDQNSLSDLMKSDVGFLGAYEAERASSLLRLAEAGFSIRLMANWPAASQHSNFLRAPFQVSGENYARAIGSFKIGLGFLRKGNRDQHTSRSIEIPACGTFLLAERTEEHQMLFEEGKEAEFFSSDDELIDKARFYLSNDSAREVIARSGRERCIRSGYDYPNRMQQMLAQVTGGAKS